MAEGVDHVVEEEEGGGEGCSRITR
jgi:hypothetical protein